MDDVTLDVESPSGGQRQHHYTRAHAHELGGAHPPCAGHDVELHQHLGAGLQVRLVQGAQPRNFLDSLDSCRVLRFRCVDHEKTETQRGKDERRHQREVKEESDEVLKTRSSARQVFQEHDGLEAEGQEDAEKGDPRPFRVAAVHQLVERQEVGDHVDGWQDAVEEDVEERLAFVNYSFKLGVLVKESLFLAIRGSHREG